MVCPGRPATRPSHEPRPGTRRRAPRPTRPRLRQLAQDRAQLRCRPPTALAGSTTGRTTTIPATTRPPPSPPPPLAALYAESRRSRLVIRCRAARSRSVVRDARRLPAAPPGRSFSSEQTRSRWVNPRRAACGRVAALTAVQASTSSSATTTDGEAGRDRRSLAAGSPPLGRRRNCRPPDAWAVCTAPWCAACSYSLRRA